MDANVSIRARVVRQSAEFVPSLAAGRSPLCIDVDIDAHGPLPAGARLLVKAHELFTDSRHERVIEVAAAPGKIQIDLSAAQLPLRPGCWHVVVDVVDENGGSLAGRDVGSAVVYACRQGESALYARGSYNLARAEFAWDAKFGIHYKTYRSELPATGDPFDEANAGRHRAEFITEEATWPELQHDGGLGFLQSACVYRALGEDERADYCDKVMRRTVSVITDLMALGDGRLASVQGVEEGRERGGHCKQQDGFALKFLSQVAMYFALGPGSDPDYARRVLEDAGSVFGYQISQPLEPGCGECGCKVYDGRILAGLAWFCLAHKALLGGYPANGALAKVQRCGELFARHALAHNGWYDAGCLTEGECHVWCGNMNLLNGLLPLRRILVDPSSGGRASHIRPHIEAGVGRAFEFLTRTNGAITGGKPFVPTVTSQWAAGNMYEICDDYLSQVGENVSVRQLMGHLVLGAGSGIVNCFHRNNTSGAVMMHCDEYRALDPKPPLPWDRAA